MKMITVFVIDKKTHLNKLTPFGCLIFSIHLKPKLLTQFQISKNIPINSICEKYTLSKLKYLMNRATRFDWLEETKCINP